jgi:hypothetical protein
MSSIKLLLFINYFYFVLRFGCVELNPIFAKGIL